jgi:hypothetical protein
MVGKASPIVFVSKPSAACLCRLFCRFANGRTSSPMFLSLCQCFCLSANGFVSSTIVFASSLTAGRLRQCFYLFANVRVSLTMVFVSSRLLVMQIPGLLRSYLFPFIRIITGLQSGFWSKKWIDDSQSVEIVVCGNIFRIKCLYLIKVAVFVPRQ